MKFTPDLYKSLIKDPFLTLNNFNDDSVTF
jgi:hypothetical protein